MLFVLIKFYVAHFFLKGNEFLEHALKTMLVQSKQQIILKYAAFLQATNINELNIASYLATW